MPAGGTLNPFATAFVPQSELKLAENVSRGPNAHDAASCSPLLELPSEVLAEILAQSISRAVDVVRCASTCTAFRDLMMYAPLKVSASQGPGPFEYDDLGHSRATLRSLQRYCPGLVELDLSSLHVESEDIAHVFKAFPCLKALRLESCKKLGPRVVKLLHSDACSTTCNVDGSRNEVSEGSTSSGGRGKRLEVLDLRRCYQLTAEALTVFLHRMAESQLRGVFLSHLSLQSWPLNGSNWAETCNLQILALNNSFLLTPASLQAISLACPRLQLLMLGGCTIGSPSVLGQLDLPPAGQLLPAAIAAVQAACLAAPDSEIALAERVQAFAVQMCLTIAALPHLHAVEITFMPPGVATSARSFLEQQALRTGPREGEQSSTPQIWDYCEEASLMAASRLHQGLTSLPQVAGGWYNRSSEQRLALTLALQAATTSASGTRRSPLHIAAERGLLGNARMLLSLGASVDAKDRGGASPLFRACFFGHDKLVALLLDAGAGLRHHNSAFETPLYIAALRGHTAVVQLLLDVHHRAGVRWQEPDLYESGWTPLMAATVAPAPHHLRVAALCLHAAATFVPAAALGPSHRQMKGGLGGALNGIRPKHQFLHSSSTAEMCVAGNRFGQNALHLAARRGDPDLLEMLLTAAAEGNPQRLRTAVEKRDISGATPFTVAKQAQHETVARVLLDASKFV